METRYGVHGTVSEGVFFTEKPIPGAVTVEHLRIEISRQNSNLSEVKSELARRAQSLGATAIMNFRYGQKKHEWWEQLFTFKWDSESWYGEGDAVRM